MSDSAEPGAKKWTRFVPNPAWLALPLALVSAYCTYLNFQLNKANAVIDNMPQLSVTRIVGEPGEFPRSVEIKNQGKRTIYGIDVSGSVTSYLPPRNPNAISRPTKLSSTKLNLAAGETMEAFLPRNIPADWDKVLSGSVLMNIHIVTTFGDLRQGQHAQWSCYEYVPDSKQFLWCRDFKNWADVSATWGDERVTSGQPNTHKP